MPGKDRHEVSLPVEQVLVNYVMLHSITIYRFLHKYELLRRGKYWFEMGMLIYDVEWE